MRTFARASDILLAMLKVGIGMVCAGAIATQGACSSNDNNGKASTTGGVSATGGRSYQLAPAAGGNDATSASGGSVNTGGNGLAASTATGGLVALANTGQKT